MDYRKYLKQAAIRKLTASRVSTRVRAKFPTYHSLMITSKGNALKLLGSSTKTEKNLDNKPIKVSVLYLSPSYEAGMGINVCPNAMSCKESCLSNSGRLALHISNRIAKTRAFIGYPAEFLTQLIMDIQIKAYEAWIRGDVLYVRLNGTSDIIWEDYIDLEALVADTAGLAGFYDYTKFPLSSRSPTPAYHLTYSVDERKASLTRAKQYRDAGYPIAVVATEQDHKALVKGAGLTDGDRSDHRFFDTGVVVLKAKRLFNGKKYKQPGVGLVRSLRQILALV